MLRSPPPPSGFTLLEVTITMGIMILIVMAVGVFSVSVFRHNRVLSNRIDAEIQMRRLVAQFTKEVRTASASSLGAYSIESASATSLVFYANIDADSLKERVRYFLDGTTLKKGTIKPSGTPLTYNPVNEQVATLVQAVRNTDVFSYYPQAYPETAPPLAFPVDVTAVRLVRLRVVIDQTPGESPNQFEIQTTVQIRNLKDT